MSSFLGLAETLAGHGLPCSLTTDRAAIISRPPEAGGKVAKDVLTQVGRALRQLGIKHIPAYSPEARGRSERMFRTLQDPLPKELQLTGIGDDVAAANRFIAEVYLPAHNARFAAAPEEAGSTFVPMDGARWRDVLSLRRSAPSPRTTPSPGTGGGCRSRRTRAATTSSGRRWGA